MRLRHARPNRVAHREQRPQNDRKEIGGISEQLAMSVFCEVNPLLSRLHHERISFRLRLRSTAKTLKRKLCLAGSVLSSHPSGQVWFHPFFHHLLSIDSLQNDCLSDSKIWSDFNTFGFLNLFNAPANTQSINDYIITARLFPFKHA